MRSSSVGLCGHITTILADYLYRCRFIWWRRLCTPVRNCQNILNQSFVLCKNWRFTEVTLNKTPSATARVCLFLHILSKLPDTFPILMNFRKFCKLANRATVCTTRAGKRGRGSNSAMQHFLLTSVFHIRIFLSKHTFGVKIGGQIHRSHIKHIPNYQSKRRVISAHCLQLPDTIPILYLKTVVSHYLAAYIIHTSAQLPEYFNSIMHFV